MTIRVYDAAGNLILDYQVDEGDIRIDGAAGNKLNICGQHIFKPPYRVEIEASEEP